MVTLDELAALDAVLWQRNGKLASQALGCNQSTISRRITRTLDSFQLTMTRRHGEWQVLGNPLLLQMAGQVHHTAGVAHFVVIPSVDLEHRASSHHG